MDEDYEYEMETCSVCGKSFWDKEDPCVCPTKKEEKNIRPYSEVSKEIGKMMLEALNNPENHDKAN